MSKKSAIIVGSGFGSLCCAALLAKEGLQVKILEQNYLPGGCTSSYWRKGFVFEAGATTVVGMDAHMPLRHVVESLGIQIPMRRLETPMKVHQGDILLTRYQNIDQWIKEVSIAFSGDQEGFWRKCYEVSQFVWNSSTRYLQFPPTKASDFLSLIKNFDFPDLGYARYALISTEKMMKKYGVDTPQFRAFVNEQLMITAQNTPEEVNFLFGAAALCYTNYGNYYIDGGLVNLVNPIIQYMEENGGEIIYRTGVKSIEKKGQGYHISTTKEAYDADFVVSGIPINNTKQIFPGLNLKEGDIMESKQLNGAFQMGIGFRSDQEFDCLHHQIHLDQPLPETNSHSIFISLSHSQDTTRSDEPGHRVASISTHIADPENTIVENEKTEEAILDELEKRGFLKREDIVYQHSSSPQSWYKWTRREWGFVGGYPQYLKIKPWQMLDARLDRDKAYICGDTVYPGQGIPGTALSGIIAYEKLKSDWL